MMLWRQKGVGTLDGGLTRRLWHSKALHCYALLSLWILLLVAGIYKFLEPHRHPPTPAVATELFRTLEFNSRTRRIFRLCNLPDEIEENSEGGLDQKQWKLKGILIVLRHGDRGPLQHIRNVSHINCAGWKDDSIHSYQEYIQNVSLNGRVTWVGAGPFHGFPLLPTHPNQCQLGQLTMQGVSQLIRLGRSMRDNYLLIWPKLLKLLPDEIVVFSTRYRRTFQSALAFLYGFYGEHLAHISIQESPSMSFCFQDCGCPISERYDRYLKIYLNQQLVSHPAVSVLAENTARSVFSIGPQRGVKADPHVVRDALLTYICHDSGLPCRNSADCVKRQNVAGIFAYTDWVNHQKWGNINWKRFSLLKSYGLIKDIVSQMLRIVSNSGPFLTLYSGHDHTLAQLLTALGLQLDPLMLRYAGRIVFEVYQNTKQNSVNDVYFRVLINGKDVTRQVGFCKDMLRNLCKIENIVRFIHDDYFTMLNFTNFKDACVSFKT